MATLSAKVQIPESFEGLLDPYRFKVFYGGRGAGKSRTFGDVLLINAAAKKKRVLCAREVQNSIKDSVKRLLDDEIDRLEMRSVFYSTDNEIRNVNTGSLFLFTGLRTNPERIKSYEAIDICWVEEAESMSEHSLDLLIPTIRGENSEIWFSYNPERMSGAVHKKFVLNTPPPRSLVKKVTYRDNPWFPSVLDEERKHCLAVDPDKYDHIWEGNPVTMSKGSYYGKALAKLKDQGRITSVPADPALLVHTCWDLGMADSMAIWFFQFHSRGPVGEYRFIDYYENSGEGLAHYAGVLERKGYNYGKHIGPHDIAVRELGTGKSRIETARNLGLRFEVCPMLPVDEGIDACRDIIPVSWFDAEKCEKGLECLWGYQHEWDDRNNCYKNNPLHDWTSHGADAFRTGAVGFRKPATGGPLPSHTSNNYSLRRA